MQTPTPFRQQLSGGHALIPAIVFTLLLITFLLTTNLMSVVLSAIPGLGMIGDTVVSVVIYFGIYKCVTWLVRKEVYIEFDCEFLYLVDKKSKEEKRISLSNVLSLKTTNLHRVNLSMFVRHIITYRDVDARETKEVTFLSLEGNDTLKDFVRLVRMKNSHFSN